MLSFFSPSLSPKERFLSDLDDLKGRLAWSQHSSLYLLFLRNSIEKLGKEISQLSDLSNKTLSDIVDVYREIDAQQKNSFIHSAYAVFYAVAHFFGYNPAPTVNYAEPLLQGACRIVQPRIQTHPLFFTPPPPDSTSNLELIGLGILDQGLSQRLEDYLSTRAAIVSSLSAKDKSQMMHQLLAYFKNGQREPLPAPSVSWSQVDLDWISYLTTRKGVTLQPAQEQLHLYLKKLVYGCTQEMRILLFQELESFSSRQFWSLLEKASELTTKEDSYELRIAYLKLDETPLNWQDILAILQSFLSGDDSLEGRERKIETLFCFLSSQYHANLEKILQSIPDNDLAWTWNRIESHWDFVLLFCEKVNDFPSFSKGLALMESLTKKSRGNLIQCLTRIPPDHFLFCLEDISNLLLTNKDEIEKNFGFVFLFYEKNPSTPFTMALLPRWTAITSSLSEKKILDLIQSIKNDPSPLEKQLDAIDTSLRRPNSSFPSISKKNPVDPSVLGIRGITNTSNNDWLISLLQMMMHVPSLKDALSKIKESTLTSFIKEYNSQTYCCTSSSDLINEKYISNIRQYLHTKNPKLSNQEDRQEDPKEGLKTLLDQTKKIKPIFNDVHEKESANQITGAECLISLSLTAKQLHTLQSPQASLFEKRALLKGSLDAFFQAKKENGLFTYSEFSSLPSELLLQIERFPHENNTPGEITNQIYMPFNFYLPKRLVQTKEEGDYECDAFITHLPNKGGRKDYYATYLKKDTQCFLCLDSDIIPISLEGFQQAMHLAYLYHFTKM